MLHLTRPPLTQLAHPHHLGHEQENRPQGERRAREGLRGPVTPRAVDDGPRDGRAREHGEGDNRENHAHPDAQLAQVAGEEAQRGGEQALHARGEDAVEDAPGVEPGDGVHGHPAEDEEGGRGAHGDEDVDGADAVGEVVWRQAADHAHAVEDEEEVEALGEGHGVREAVAGEGGEVVEGEVYPPEELFSHPKLISLPGLLQLRQLSSSEEPVRGHEGGQLLTRKAATAYDVYSSSLKACISMIGPCLLGLILGLARMFEMARHTS